MSLRRRAALALAGAGVVALLAVVATADPAASAGYPKCLFFIATGLACPGCGSTRALHALLHLDLVAAFRFNPLLLLLPPLAALWIGAERRRRSGRAAAARAAPWLLGLVVVGFTVWRNLPGYPLTAVGEGLRSPFAAGASVESRPATRR